MQRHGNCCKETVRNETKKLLQYFLQSDSDCFAELPLPPQRLTTHFGPKKVPTPLPIGAFMISAVERTDATDDIASAEQTVTESSRTKLEQELLQELRRLEDEIDQNGKLKANVRQATEEVASLLAYNSFKSTVNQYVDNLVGWGQVAFVFQFTNRAIQAAGTAGLNARRITENCLKYVEDTCADWIVKRGGWENMLSGDSGNSTSDLD